MIQRLRAIRSTPLRLTAILVAIFVASSAASFAVAYFVIRSTFDATLQDKINQKFATYQAITSQGELLERLTVDADSTDPELLILHYLPDRGAVIANIAHIPPISGLSVVSKRAIDTDDLRLAES